MAAKTQVLDNLILNFLLRANPGGALVSPATVYAALYTTAPTPTTAGTEVAGDTYVRVAVTFGAPVGGISTNSAPVAFPTAGALWGTIAAVGIWDSLAGGALLYFGTLTTPKAVDNGDTASFAALALSVQEQ